MFISLLIIHSVFFVHFVLMDSLGHRITCRGLRSFRGLVIHWIARLSFGCWCLHYHPEYLRVASVLVLARFTWSNSSMQSQIHNIYIPGRRWAMQNGTSIPARITFLHDCALVAGSRYVQYINPELASKGACFCIKSTGKWYVFSQQLYVGQGWI